jgi:uncharacterized protein YabN with tetrapyrrole methylase and pyrophosphatase domain
MSLPDEKDARREYGEELRSRREFASVMTLIEALLGENGCPWDRDRKLQDCPKYLEGELDEVIEAIASGDDANLEEELGDLLFMVAFTMKVAEKEGRLSPESVYGRILNKMVHRHPHVFGGEMVAETPGEVLDNWDKLKEQEKAK